MISFIFSDSEFSECHSHDRCAYWPRGTESPTSHYTDWRPGVRGHSTSRWGVRDTRIKTRDAIVCQHSWYSPLYVSSQQPCTFSPKSTFQTSDMVLKQDLCLNQMYICITEAGEKWGHRWLMSACPCSRSADIPSMPFHAAGYKFSRRCELDTCTIKLQLQITQNSADLMPAQGPAGTKPCLTLLTELRTKMAVNAFGKYFTVQREISQEGTDQSSTVDTFPQALSSEQMFYCSTTICFLSSSIITCIRYERIICREHQHL